MKVSCQLSRAYLTQHAQSQTDNVVIVAVEVNADTIGRHH